MRALFGLPSWHVGLCSRLQVKAKAKVKVPLLVGFLLSLAMPTSAAELLSASAATHRSDLQTLAEQNGKQAERDEAEVDALVRSQGLIRRRVLPDGEVIGLQRFAEGVPLYLEAHNRNSAISISVDDIQPGGSAGLALDGAGQTPGIWDVGSVLGSHQEIGGRSITEDAAALSNHATHVAGTILASGVQPSARGMAFNAPQIRSWDFFSDVSEMTNHRLSPNPVMVSNHSYGLISGWAYGTRGDSRWAWYGNVGFDPNEDVKFGRYETNARAWDTLAVSSPYYVMVKSAGNDRNDNGPAPGTTHWHYYFGWVLANDTHAPDGDALGYDTIGGGAGSAKNILTIGAVNDVFGGYSGPGSVGMSSFSGWGPTNDGRIKPDLVANGVGLYSPLADSNASYGNYSGTSMSTPSTTGAVMLLQQHARNLYNADLMSATIRALLIHTADETGAAPGPDYSFGWGLVNAKNAAQVLSADASEAGDHSVHELLLTNGTPQTLFVDRATAGGSLKVTIVWTDPAGPLQGLSEEQAVVSLVNDLDVRVIGPQGAVYQPWTLDPNNRTAPAQRGDNVLDPVEQVIVSGAVAGTWRIEVTHKGALQAGTQAVSVIVSGGDAVPGTSTEVLLQEFNLSAIPGSRVRRTVEVPANASSLIFAIAGGSGNADLYVRRGARPTKSRFDCRPLLPGSDESCVFSGPDIADTYELMIDSSVGASGISLSVIAQTGSVPNEAPVAAFTNQQQTGSLSVDFDGSTSSDSDGVIEGYVWDFGDGSIGTGVNVTHTYAAAGDYQVSLTVTDDAAETASQVNTVSVMPVDDRTVVALEQTNIDLATRARVRYTVDIPEGASNLRVTLSGGTGNADLYVRRGARPTLSVYDCRPFENVSEEECVTSGAVEAGVYHLMVRARAAVNDAQLVVTYSTSTSGNQAPMANFTSSVVADSTTLNVDATSSTDADGEIVDYAWSFGDGSTGNGVTQQHTYASAGSYTVTLTVTDDENATAVASELVEVGVVGSAISLSLTWGGGGSHLFVDWAGAEGSGVFINRNGSRLKSTGNDGQWRDNSPLQNANYQVCERLGGACSAVVNSGTF